MLSNVSCEKDQLLAERTSHSYQLKEEISVINQEKQELQKLLQDVRSERDQLKEELQKNSDKVGVGSCIPSLFVTSLLEWYLNIYIFIIIILVC